MQIDKFIGDESFSLEHRIINILFLFGIVLIILNVAFSYIFSLVVPLMVSIFCSVAVPVLYYFSLMEKRYLLARRSAIALIYLFVPVLWISNGGAGGGIAFYIFIFSSMIVISYEGVKRIILTAGLLTVSLALIVIEYRNPSLIVGYTTNFDRYADYTFTLLSGLILNLLVYVVILNEYNKEHKRAQKLAVLIEEKNREIEMAHLDRLRLVGEMAASVGHEVRNPLTTVRGFLQLMQVKKTYLADREYFEIMIKELDRTNSIITEFLSLARKRTYQMKTNNLNCIVQLLFPLLTADSKRMGKQFKIELGDIPDLLVDENAIRQCIINLVRNGLEATKEEVCLRTYLDDEHVVLAVQDNGSGIPPEIYNKLGVPFVTTKPQGTGLGIPICYKIAERHNAKIEITTGSEGTVFAVRFKNCGNAAAAL
jgi:signal transduction histidine kinase